MPRSPQWLRKLGADVLVLPGRWARTEFAVSSAREVGRPFCRFYALLSGTWFRGINFIIIAPIFAAASKHVVVRKFLTGKALVLTFAFIVPNDSESSVGGSLFARRYGASLGCHCVGPGPNDASTGRRPSGHLHSNRRPVRRSS